MLQVPNHALKNLLCNQLTRKLFFNWNQYFWSTTLFILDTDLMQQRDVSINQFYKQSILISSTNSLFPQKDVSKKQFSCYLLNWFSILDHVFHNIFAPSAKSVRTSCYVHWPIHFKNNYVLARSRKIKLRWKLNRGKIWLKNGNQLN